MRTGPNPSDLTESQLLDVNKMLSLILELKQKSKQRETGKTNNRPCSQSDEHLTKTLTRSTTNAEQN